MQTTPRQHNEICGYTLSEHATTRMNERGVGKETVELLITHSDRELHVGDDCYMLRISAASLPHLKAEGVCASKMARLKCIAVIVSYTNHVIVTVMHDCRGLRDWYSAEDTWTTRGRLSGDRSSDFP